MTPMQWMPMTLRLSQEVLEPSEQCVVHLDLCRCTRYAHLCFTECRAAAREDKKRQLRNIDSYLAKNMEADVARVPLAQRKQAYRGTKYTTVGDGPTDSGVSVATTQHA